MRARKTSSTWGRSDASLSEEEEGENGGVVHAWRTRSRICCYERVSVRFQDQHQSKFHATAGLFVVFMRATTDMDILGFRMSH
jgi:hypothetical protein